MVRTERVPAPKERERERERDRGRGREGVDIISASESCERTDAFGICIYTHAQYGRKEGGEGERREVTTAKTSLFGTRL